MLFAVRSASSSQLPSSLGQLSKLGTQLQFIIKFSQESQLFYQKPALVCIIVRKKQSWYASDNDLLLDTNRVLQRTFIKTHLDSFPRKQSSRLGFEGDRPTAPPRSCSTGRAPRSRSPRGAGPTRSGAPPARGKEARAGPAGRPVRPAATLTERLPPRAGGGGSAEVGGRQEAVPGRRREPTWSPSDARGLAEGAAEPGRAAPRRHVAGRVRAALRLHQLRLRQRVLGPGRLPRRRRPARRAGGAALHPHPHPGPRRLRRGHPVPSHRGRPGRQPSAPRPPRAARRCAAPCPRRRRRPGSEGLPLSHGTLRLWGRMCDVPFIGPERARSIEAKQTLRPLPGSLVPFLSAPG